MEEEAKILLHPLVYKPQDEAIQRLIRMRDEALESALKLYNVALTHIEPKYHCQFIMLTVKGEASPEFLAYIDHNEQAQKACEMVFEAQARSLHALARAIREGCLERLANEAPDVTLIRREK